MTQYLEGTITSTGGGDRWWFHLIEHVGTLEDLVVDQVAGK